MKNIPITFDGMLEDERKSQPSSLDGQEACKTYTMSYNGFVRHGFERGSYREMRYYATDLETAESGS